MGAESVSVWSAVDKVLGTELAESKSVHETVPQMDAGKARKVVMGNASTLSVHDALESDSGSGDGLRGSMNSDDAMVHGQATREPHALEVTSSKAPDTAIPSAGGDTAACVELAG